MARKTAEVIGSLMRTDGLARLRLKAVHGDTALSSRQRQALLDAFGDAQLEDCALAIDPVGQPITGQSVVVVLAVATEPETDTAAF